MEQKKYPARNSRQHKPITDHIDIIQHISGAVCLISVMLLIGIAGADNTDYFGTAVRAITAEAVFMYTFGTWYMCRIITEKRRKNYDHYKKRKMVQPVHR